MKFIQSEQPTPLALSPGIHPLGGALEPIKNFFFLLCALELVSNPVDYQSQVTWGSIPWGCVRVLVTQSWTNLCDSRDCSQSGSSAHVILQARILERVAIPFFRGSSQPRDRTRLSCIADRSFTIWVHQGFPGGDSLPVVWCCTEGEAQTFLSILLWLFSHSPHIWESHLTFSWSLDFSQIKFLCV